jgi:hypothetical protein
MEDTDPSRERIFFSYSRRDQEFALQLAKDLRSRGVQIWLDQLDIPGGARWDDEIEAAMRVTKTTLVILSPDSVASEHVRDEVNLALRDNDRIIPVLYRACEVPMRLSRMQYVDFTGDYARALDQLHVHCTRVAGAAGKSPAEPARNLAGSLQPVVRSDAARPKRFGLVQGLVAGGVGTLLALIAVGLAIDDSDDKLRAVLNAELEAVKSAGLALGNVDCPKELDLEPGGTVTCTAAAEGVPLSLQLTARTRVEGGSIDYFDVQVDGAVAAAAVEQEAQKRYGADYRVHCPHPRWVAKPQSVTDCGLSLGAKSSALHVRTTDAHGGFDLDPTNALPVNGLVGEFEGDYNDISGVICGALRVVLQQPGPAQVCTLQFNGGDAANMNLTFALPGGEVIWEPSTDADDQIAEKHRAPRHDASTAGQ